MSVNSRCREIFLFFWHRIVSLSHTLEKNNVTARKIIRSHIIRISNEQVKKSYYFGCGFQLYYSDFIQSLSFIQPFEYSLFYFENFTFRAAPRFRKILKRSTRGDPGLGIAFLGIIDIMAFKTNPTCEFNFFCHVIIISLNIF
jgi:hypothetical protein